MATFVHLKTRAFRSSNDSTDLPIQPKSLFHMKTYNSATDPRAWTINSIDRKQYILDMFTANENANADKSLEPPNEIFIGKYVNIQALLKTLLTNKDADIVYLQNQVSIMECFIDSVELSSEQKESLQVMRAENARLEVSESATALRARKSTMDITNLSDEDTDAPNTSHNDLIDELNRKFEEQESELRTHKALAHQAISKLSRLKTIIGERDTLLKKNRYLVKSINCLRNTKSSSNKDLTLQTEISKLRIELEDLRMKKAKTKLQVGNTSFIVIAPQENQVRPIGTSTSRVDFNKIVDERDDLKATVSSLLCQIDELNNQPRRSSSGDYHSFSTTTATQDQQDPFLEQSTRITKELNREVDHLRDKLKSFEVKELECDRLRLRIDELTINRKGYVEARDKLQATVQEQQQRNAQQRNHIDYLKEQIVCLEAQLAHYKPYKDENDALSEKCNHLQRALDTQRHLETLQPSKQENVFKISEQKLLALQSQLRATIDSLTCESTILKNSLHDAHQRIAGLLEEENHNQIELRRMRDSIEAKDKTLRKMAADNDAKNYAKQLQQKDAVIEQMRDKLYELQHENEHLGALGKRMQSYINRKPQQGDGASSGVDDMQQSTSRKQRIDSIHSAMQQLQRDLSQATVSCDDPEFFALQNRYREIQTLARNQVHWLAGELRQCKSRVKYLESNFITRK